MAVMCYGALCCESEYDRGAGCGKTARPDLHGGPGVIWVPTITEKGFIFTGIVYVCWLCGCR